MGKTIDTHLLRVEEFDTFWPLMTKELKKVSHIWSLHWTLESIYENVMNEHMQCWGSGWDDTMHVFLFTRIACFPSNRIIQSMFMFGNSLKDCLPSIAATVESFALANGCTRVEIVGRKGWKGYLPSNGYKEYAVMYSKNLEKGRLQ